MLAEQVSTRMEGFFGRYDARRVVGQVQEQRHALHTAVLLKVAREEARRLQVDTHSSKHNGEVVLVVVVYALVHALLLLLLLLHQPRLPTDLRRDLVVRQTCSREDRNLLATCDGVHGVNGGDTGRNHLLGVQARVRVDRRAVDVQVVLRKHLGSLVDSSSAAVEDAAQHVLADAQLQAVARELDFGLLHVDAGRALEDLHHGAAAACFEDLTTALSAIRER